MKITRAVEVPGEWLHVAVNHITGPVGARMLESQDEVARLGAQLLHGLPGRSSEGAACPGVEFSHLAIEGVRRLGLIDGPDTALQLRENAEPFSTLAYLEEGVEEALNNHDERKQGLPGLLGGRPAIGVHRWLVAHPTSLANLVSAHRGYSVLPPRLPQ